MGGGKRLRKILRVVVAFKQLLTIKYSLGSSRTKIRKIFKLLIGQKHLVLFLNLKANSLFKFT